jgi:hypothetical protein
MNTPAVGTNAAFVRMNTPAVETNAASVRMNTPAVETNVAFGPTNPPWKGKKLASMLPGHPLVHTTGEESSTGQSVGGSDQTLVLSIS